MIMEEKMRVKKDEKNVLTQAKGFYINKVSYFLIYLTTHSQKVENNSHNRVGS